MTDEERASFGRALLRVIHFIRPARGADLDAALIDLDMPRLPDETDYQARKRVASAFALDIILPH